MKNLIIIGASGHGKVIAAIAVRNGYEDIVFLDDADYIQPCAGFPVIGKTSMPSHMDGDVIVAIGNASVRERIQESIQNQKRVKLATLIHPNTVINSDVVIGKGCIINIGASVDHDCKVEDFAHVSVGAHVAGTCCFGQRTWGGAGAVVTKNFKKSGTYIGVPAKEKCMKKVYAIHGGVLLCQNKESRACVLLAA